MANVSSINGNQIVVGTDGMENGSVTDLKLAPNGVIKKIEPVGNIFNKDKTTPDYLYYYSTGEYQHNSSGYGASEFMPCTAGSKYIMNKLAHVCFWDSDKNYISGMIQPVNGFFTVMAAPSNASYITISVKESEKDKCVLVESDSALVEFRQYGEHLTYEADDKCRVSKALHLLGDGFIPIDVNMVAGLISTDGSVNYPDSSAYVIADYFASDYFTVPNNCSCMVRSSDPSLVRVWWHAFDENKNSVAHGDGWKEYDEIPAGYPYYRVYAHINGDYSVNAFIPNLGNRMVEVGYGIGEAQSGKLPYESGYIYHQFQVPATKALTSESNINTAYLRLPESYKQYGNPTKLCLLVHGASLGISSDGSSGWTNDELYNNVVNALLDAGYAVIDSNGYDDSVSNGHDHWGCPQALAGYHKAWDYFTTKYNLEREVYVYGFSMGGLTSLNLATERTIPIKCMMIGSPVISLYDQCVSGTATSVNPTFLAAYGITAYSEDAVGGYDRYLDIVNVGSDGYVFNNLPPLFIGYGSTDVNISNEKIQEYYEALCNSNHIVTLKEYSGGHEISYGGNATLITDMVTWFSYY